MEREKNAELLTLAEIRLILDGPTEHLIEFSSSPRINAVDRKGDTPLHLAARTGNIFLCDLFIRSGCDPEALNQNKLTPAEVAFSEGHDATGQLLSSITDRLISVSTLDKADPEGQERIDSKPYKKSQIPSESNAVSSNHEDYFDHFEFVEDEDPYLFSKGSAVNSAYGTFSPVTNTSLIESIDTEKSWELDISPNLVVGDGISSLPLDTPEQSNKKDFLTVGARGPRSRKNVMLPQSTTFNLDQDTCATWAREITCNGWFSAHDIENLLMFCRGDADFDELRANIIRALEVAGIEMSKAAEVSVYPLDSLTNTSSDDLAETIFAICNRAVGLPGTGRFDMSLDQENVRSGPMIRAKQELLLEILSCETAIDGILASVVTGTKASDQEEDPSKTAIIILRKWNTNGRIMDGRPRREALMALTELNLPLDLFKKILSSLHQDEQHTEAAIRLGAKISAYESCVRQLTLDCLPLVRRFTSRNVTDNEDPEDGFQVGFMGLNRAAINYNSELGNRFSTYAVLWMQQFLNRWRGDESRLIRIPIHRHDKLSIIEQKIEEFEATHCRAPTDDQLSCELALDLAEIKKHLEIPRFITYPDTLHDWDDIFFEVREEELIDNSSPFENLATANLRELIQHLLASLTTREAKVLRMRFGIDMNRDHTLEEVGKKFDLTRERIRQIEVKALRKLRHPSRSEQLKDYLDID
jgi:RNA polymerase primary sigma factor